MDLPDFLTRNEMGGIRITGHRIDLYHIVELYHEGYSAEMIHHEFPTLPLAVIYKVMAYYLENKAEVDSYVAETDAEVERLRAEYQPGPGIQRLRDLRAAQTKPSSRL